MRLAQSLLEPANQVRTGTEQALQITPRWGKSNALRSLEGRLRSATIPFFSSLSPCDWRSNRDGELQRLRGLFAGQLVAVRSDACHEDQAASSMAGHYRSVLNTGPVQLCAAIDEVMGSMPCRPADAVMVQAMVVGVAFAGVCSTHRISDGAPWYGMDLAPDHCAAVTGGRTSGRHTAVSRASTQAGRIGALRMPAQARAALTTLLEVERLLPGQPLEIEVALTAAPAGGYRVHLLQVRPIAAANRWAGPARAAQLPELAWMALPDPAPQVSGASTVLSLMADWNPAELLGTHPRPLALSLFRHLIADRVWWRARASLGYRRVPAAASARLLHVLAGRPWVDIRRSANSLVPAGTPPATCALLVDHWVDRLRQAPELHDKVEFLVYRTARDFTPEATLQAHWSTVLGQAAWQDWEHRLGRLTRRLMDPRGPIAAQNEVIERLHRATPDALSLHAVLGACRQGTLAFAMLARMAFVGEAQLRSAVQRGALSEERALALRASVCRWGTHADEDSRHRDGHLRSGTFDIRQPCWAARGWELQPGAQDAGKAFQLTPAEERDLRRLLQEAGLEGTAPQWVDFVRRGAQSREWGKHVFSRHLSAALERMALLGAQAGCDREDLSWLDWPQFATGLRAKDRAGRLARWRERIAESREQHHRESRLPVSPLLRDEQDRHVADSLGVLPNFVGLKVAKGPAVLLGANAGPMPGLRGAVVLLHHADPGFDWLFDCGIGGLVTAWGGANSHMAIRCAEFGVSAAIGCGEHTWARAVNAREVCVDPAGGALWLS